jgi:predicted nucleic acid-binding protein
MMSAIFVDSNILLDIMTEDPRWFAWSSETLARCADNSSLVINPIVYAEISIRFKAIEDQEDALPNSMIERRDIPWAATFLAGKCFMKYRRAGGKKTAPLPEFFIGAHAAVEKMDLLTRDPSRYRTYFPTVRLITPRR